MSRIHARGTLVARVLAGSWRSQSPPLELSPDELAEVAPVLLATGAAGLGWWRLRQGPLVADGPASALHDAFRLQTLDARLQERKLARAAGVLAEGGGEFLLAKGWAVARLYAQPGLRPYGDFDLFVAPEHHAGARAVLAAHEEDTARVDLHRGVPMLGRGWSRIRGRAEYAEVDGVPLLVLGAEDHLALLCAHLFFHGAWRPTWLCDVAALVEALPRGFDWGLIEDTSPRLRAQCRAAVLLAGRLLDADLSRTPWSGGRETLPRWLPRAVLRAWGAAGHYSVTTRIGLTEPAPRPFLEAVRVRWPNPVEATFRWHAPLNDFPRFPFQILDVMARAARLMPGR